MFVFFVGYQGIYEAVGRWNAAALVADWTTWLSVFVRLLLALALAHEER